MKIARWIVVGLLVIFAGLTLEAIVSTYQSSQNSLFDRWGKGRLALNVLRILAEVSVIGVSLLWQRRVPLVLRVLALLVVVYRVGILAVLAGAYLQAIQRWGVSTQSAGVVSGYLAFVPAAVLLIQDFVSRRAKKPPPN